MHLQITLTISFLALTTSADTNRLNLTRENTKLTLTPPQWLHENHLSDEENHHRHLPFSLIANDIINSTSHHYATHYDTVHSLLFPLIHQNLITSPNPAYSDPQSYLEILFKSLLNIGTQIPPFHPGHEKLASLLYTLQHQAPSPPPVRGQKIPGQWDILQTFNAILHDMFVEREIYYDKESSKWVNENAFVSLHEYNLTSVEWLNLNAFTTLLGGKAWEHGFWLLSNTLERNLPIEKLDYDIPAAAIWAIMAGNCFTRRSGRQLENPWGEGTHEYHYPSQRWMLIDRRFEGQFAPNGVGFWNWMESPGLSDKRLRFWERRFEELSRVKDLKDETREWAEGGAGALAESWHIWDWSNCGLNY